MRLMRFKLNTSGHHHDLGPWELKSTAVRVFYAPRK